MHFKHAPIKSTYYNWDTTSNTWISPSIGIFYYSPQEIIGFEEQNELATNVFPNPSTGFINVNLSALNDASVTVFDINGQVVSTDTHISESNYQIYLNQPAGLYFIEISAEGKKQRYKLLKQ